MIEIITNQWERQRVCECRAGVPLHYASKCAHCVQSVQLIKISEDKEGASASVCDTLPCNIIKLLERQHMCDLLKRNIVKTTLRPNEHTSGAMSNAPCCQATSFQCPRNVARQGVPHRRAGAFIGLPLMILCWQHCTSAPSLCSNDSFTNNNNNNNHNHNHNKHKTNNSNNTDNNKPNHLNICNINKTSNNTQQPHHYTRTNCIHYTTAEDVKLNIRSL